MDNQTTKEYRLVLREKYNGKETAGFFDDIRRIDAGEPVDYVIGWVPFLGCMIDLSFKPFIPRTETEFWVAHAIKDISAAHRAIPIRVLDMFSGSGAIGIAVLKHVPDASVDCAEKNGIWIKQIEKNFMLNTIDISHAHALQSDMFKDISGVYDVIFANPPYVPMARADSVAQSVRAYEPSDSVFGGDDGLFYIRSFLREAKAHLLPSGVIWMEFDSPEKEAITSLIDTEGYAEHEFFRDQFGEWRFVKIMK